MKKIFALILVLSLILMAGCTSGSDDKGGDTSSKDSGKTDPFAQAQEHKQAGNYDDAISGFLSVIESDPKMYLSYLELADIS
jgi:Tfp pilus assembly protein PilF